MAYEFDNAQHGADLFNLAVPGNIYTRLMNPTTDVLEQRVADLEVGWSAAVSAGSAAIHYAILTLAEAGKISFPHLNSMAGLTPCLLICSQSRVSTCGLLRMIRPESLAALIDDQTAAVFCESIGNPAGNIVDIEAVATMAHAHGVPLIVDNTVATPMLIKPISYGADIVVHSLTKYMGAMATR